MSINCASLDSDGTPLLVSGEKLFLKQSGVKLEYESGSGYPGEGHNYFCDSGVVYLTNIRVVYVPQPPLPFLKSMAIPLENLENGKFVQPWFDANRYEGNVKPVYNGGLRIPGFLKLFFTQGGGFEFSSIYLQLRSRITGEPSRPGEETLPVYTPLETLNSAPSSSSAQPSHVVPIPVSTEQPPAYEPL